MPNPKTGYSNTWRRNCLLEMQKAGQVRYRNDKNGIIPQVIGKNRFWRGTYSIKPKCVGWKH